MTVKERPDRARLLDWLADPANFAEAFIKSGDRFVALDGWQRDYLRSDAKFSAILKSRRVGGSWIMAARMFIRSQLLAPYSGVFVSMNREEARGRIDYAEAMSDSIPPRWRLRVKARSKDEIVFEDSRGRRSVLLSLAAKAPRGRGGDVGISELPHCLNQRAIYEGALHVTARGNNDQLTAESTPMGRQGVFYDLCRGKYPDFTLFEVPWWLSSALCVDTARAAIDAPAMSTGERVRIFGSKSLQAIYASMPEDVFRRESEIEFSETEGAAFPMELIMKHAEADFGPSTEAALVFRKLDAAPPPAVWEWLSRSRRGQLFAGYDPGRRKDQAALVVLDRAGNKLETRLAVTLSNTPFSIQKDILGALLALGATLRIDSTGIGMDMAERAELDWPGQAKGFNFTANSKAALVAKTYSALADGAITIPAERDLVSSLASVREIFSDSGSVLYDAPSSQGRHADLAWALMLAVEAAGERDAVAKAEYASVARRRAMTGL